MIKEKIQDETIEAYKNEVIRLMKEMEKVICP